MPIDTRDPAAIRTLDRGRCYLYVAPCAYEDLLKLGFSRDPLERFRSLHPRWFEFFDVDRSLLVETETVRDARALETDLRHGLKLHNAVAPLTVVRDAGGHSEWYRGAYGRLVGAVEAYGAAGHVVHAPARAWLQAALRARRDLLYAWTEAMLGPEGTAPGDANPTLQQGVRDTIDAFAALDIPVDAHLPERIRRWYRAQLP